MFYGFDHPEDLLVFGEAHRIDIVVMDVNLGQLNGIEYVNLLHREQTGVQVIFVTGYSENRSLVYEAEHMYYLDKPINEALLFRALQKAVQTVEAMKLIQSPQLLVLSRGEQVVVVNMDFIKKCNKYLELIFYISFDFFSMPIWFRGISIFAVNIVIIYVLTKISLLKIYVSLV